MRIVNRILTMLASFLLILVIVGCEAPAESTAASGARAPLAALEQALVDEGAGESLTGSPTGASADSTGEPTLDPSTAGVASNATAESNFGGASDLDDPFALIGPALSGLGIQSYSSACDPFDDAYGTCL